MTNFEPIADLREQFCEIEFCIEGELHFAKTREEALKHARTLATLCIADDLLCKLLKEAGCDAPDSTYVPPERLQDIIEPMAEDFIAKYWEGA